MNLYPILDRLEKVRQVKPDEYTACCPAHADRSPSLSITDAGDRVLLHCHAGCSFGEIAAALDMKSHDFFADGKAPQAVAPGISQRSLNAALALELATVYVIACDRSKGRNVSPDDLARDRLAKQRILTAWRTQP